MSRLMIGAALSARLHAAEAAIDQAMVDTAGLAAALPAARLEAALSATAGQKAFDEAAASLSALADARAHIVRTHHALAALARVLGLESLAVGQLDKPGDHPPVGGDGDDSPVALTLVNKSLGNTPNKTLPAQAALC
ncbi:hypothetical protein [Brevundimonas sp.]|uniref:hypothetical protein n=1 Tax=Brevundimonas sp. TaxID=1871086 RepID=UPI0035B111E3